MTPMKPARESRQRPEDGTSMADIQMSQLSRVAEVFNSFVTPKHKSNRKQPHAVCI
jgi:hypothetical protein